MIQEREVVVVKYSGEALRGLNPAVGTPSFTREAVEHMAKEIVQAKTWAHIAVVVGGGNIIRGSDLIKPVGIDCQSADQVGMLATIQNGLVLENKLDQLGVEARVMTAIDMDQVAERYIPKKARSHLRKGRVIILVAGTGNSGVSTDTAAAFRASDLNARLLIKATKNGLCEEDPRKNPQARPIHRITYNEFLSRGFKQILDRDAVVRVQALGIPIQIIDGFVPGNLAGAIKGEEIGSLVTD